MDRASGLPLFAVLKPLFEELLEFAGGWEILWDTDNPSQLSHVLPTPHPHRQPTVSHLAVLMVNIRPMSLSVLFSHSVVSDSLWSHGRQRARLPCPSSTPRTCSNSCLLSPWCHPTISSSVVSFSSCLQSFSGEGNGNPLQFSCLGNPMDRGAWWATVHGITKSQTQLRKTNTFNLSQHQGLFQWVRSYHQANSLWYQDNKW